MKKPILLIFLSALIFSISKGAHAPSISPVQQHVKTASHPNVAVEIPSKRKRLTAKLEKRVQRWKKRFELPKARTSLNVCLVLLGLTILLFALSSEVTFLSVIASFTAIGAAIFFMFWLLKLKG